MLYFRKFVPFLSLILCLSISFLNLFLFLVASLSPFVTIYIWIFGERHREQWRKEKRGWTNARPEVTKQMLALHHRHIHLMSALYDRIISVFCVYIYIYVVKCASFLLGLFLLCHCSSLTFSISIIHLHCQLCLDDYLTLEIIEVNC